MSTDIIPPSPILPNKRKKLYAGATRIHAGATRVHAGLLEYMQGY